LARWLETLDSLREAREEEARLETARQRAEWERAAFVGWQTMSAWTKMPRFDAYLKRLGLEEKAAAGATALIPQMTEEEIIARAEAALRHWQAHPEKMRKVLIH